MTSTSHTFPTAVILTLATGTMVCDSFGDVHELAEFVAGQPVWTHQLASRELTDSLRTELLRQHPWLADAIENTPDFTQVPRGQVEAACRDWVHSIALHVGDTLTIEQAPDFPLPDFTAGLDNLGRQA